MNFQAFPIRAGTNAADQENLAEDRYYSRIAENREYDHDVKRRVNEKLYQQSKKKDAKDLQYSNQLRKFIYDTIEFFYNERLRYPNRKPDAKKAKQIWSQVGSDAAEMDRMT